MHKMQKKVEKHFPCSLTLSSTKGDISIKRHVYLTKVARAVHKKNLPQCSFHLLLSTSFALLKYNTIFFILLHHRTTGVVLIEIDVK